MATQTRELLNTWRTLEDALAEQMENFRRAVINDAADDIIAGIKSEILQGITAARLVKVELWHACNAQGKHYTIVERHGKAVWAIQGGKRGNPPRAL